MRFTLSQYGNFSADELKSWVRNLSRRLVDEVTRLMCGLIDEGDLASVVRLLFRYYDKACEHGEEKLW